jgi:hypothetical protein
MFITIMKMEPQDQELHPDVLYLLREDSRLSGLIDMKALGEF